MDCLSKKQSKTELPHPGQSDTPAGVPPRLEHPEKVLECRPEGGIKPFSQFSIVVNKNNTNNSIDTSHPPYHMTCRTELLRYFSKP
ncbi:MAG: hypothetical protein D6732_08920 [Methanobacteriota archaeon]|nr:MAG: hypothetical protein D6732_08920 [Euryarchaeota archaeon]